MTQALPDDISLTRRFNHDLLIEEEDQLHARRRWPAIAPLLINEPLIAIFTQHENRAKTLKRISQVLGTGAVLAMAAALLGYVAELWIGAQGRHDSPDLARPLEVCAIAGVGLAILASRHGPVRQRWLKNRFVTELLRQWHFRYLLDVKAMNDKTQVAYLIGKRDTGFADFTRNHQGVVGQKMQELSQSRCDPLGAIQQAILPRIQRRGHNCWTHIVR